MTQSLHADFEKMLTLANGMLAAVEKHDWERFSALEAEQATLVAGMQTKTESGLTPEATQVRRALINQIIEVQGKVTELVIPWRDTIASLIQSVIGARHDLHGAEAYRAEENKGSAESA